MFLFGFIQSAVPESSLLHIGGFHPCSESLCSIVQRRHLGLIGGKPNGTAPFLEREFALQFSREVSERREFCLKQFSNLGFFSLADHKNVGDIGRQLFVVELPNDLVDFSYRGFQMVRGRNWSAFHVVKALIF